MEKQIQGFSKYTFSDCGKVFSLDKKGKREVKGAKDKNGYLKITLISDDKQTLYFRKHRLIAWAFLGKSDLQVNHIDGDILNNSIANLEYVTSMENQSHRRKKEGYHVGVCWAKKENKWRAYVQYNKKWKHLGFYSDFEDAKNAYLNALKELSITNKYA
jgi:hypothetical protein